MPDGRPNHPDHRLHGQVVPGKDALLHRASLHGETLRMIKMMVKVMIMVDGGGGSEDDKIYTTLLQCLCRECQYTYQRSA